VYFGGSVCKARFIAIPFKEEECELIGMIENGV
jgi:hypothetical protein